MALVLAFLWLHLTLDSGLPPAAEPMLEIYLVVVEL